MKLSRRAYLTQCVAIALCAHLPAHARTKAQQFDVLLAQDFVPGTDPRGYLISEKFDGVRAIWDGAVLRFRSGRTIAAPAWFTSKLPRTPLDGELWLARGQFDVLSGIVRKAAPVDADWLRLTYLVFELPQDPGTFAERAQRLRELAKQLNWQQLDAVEQFQVADEPALNAKLLDVIRAGGEGLVLHRADAPYLTGRNAVLLKLKAVQDAEATVLAHVPGKGKYKGMLGALQVENTEGKRFKIGTGFSDGQRENPPPVGSVITYSYRDKTPQGVPRFASFLRAHF